MTNDLSDHKHNNIVLWGTPKIDHTKLHKESTKRKLNGTIAFDWYWWGFKREDDFAKDHDKVVCLLQISLWQWVFHFWFMRRGWHRRANEASQV